MALATVLENLDNVPETLRSYYKQVDDRFILDADVESHPQVQGLRGAYKADHEKNKALTAQLTQLKDVDPVRWSILKDLSDEDLVLLHAAKSEQSQKTAPRDASDFEIEFQKRIAPMKTAHEHEIQKREAKLREIEAERESLKTEMRRKSVENAIIAACAETGVLPGAVEEIVLLGQQYFKTNEANEVVAVDRMGVEIFGSDTKPMGPREWIMSRGAAKVHWFPLNTGGGAGGGRFGGDLRITKKSDLKDVKMKVDFIRKHGGSTFEALPD